MRFLWPLLLGVCRAFYFAYSVWCRLFPLVLLFVVATLAGAAQSGMRVSTLLKMLPFVGLFLFILFVIIYVRAKLAGQGNPWQSAFMSWFGTIKSFRNHLDAPIVTLQLPSAYLVENPSSYRITGRDMRAILDAIEPGDILLRGFEGYVDGYFIRQSSCCSEKGFQKGWFTHVALYAGKLTEADRKFVPAAFSNTPQYFSPGPQMVIHAMAKGVHTEDILTFCRCDYLALLRVKPKLKAINGEDRACLAEYLADAEKPRGEREGFSPSERCSVALEHALKNGKMASSRRAILAAKLSALERIGATYDFDCSDQKFDRFTCAQFVYFCYRGVTSALDLKPRTHAFYPLAPWIKNWHIMARDTITPDDYYDLTNAGSLVCVWEDKVSRQEHRNRSGSGQAISPPSPGVSRRRMRRERFTSRTAAHSPRSVFAPIIDFFKSAVELFENLQHFRVKMRGQCSSVAID